MAQRKGLHCRTCSSIFGYAHSAAASVANADNLGSSSVSGTTTTSSSSSSRTDTAAAATTAVYEPPPPVHEGCVVAAEDEEFTTVTFAKGQAVLYQQRDGSTLAATVEQVDLTVAPPQYGVRLPGADDLRFTIAAKLTAVTEPSSSKEGTSSSSSSSSSSKAPSATAFDKLTLEQEVVRMSVQALRQALQAAGLDSAFCTFREGMVGKLVSFQQLGVAEAAGQAAPAATPYTASQLLDLGVDGLQDKLAAAGGLGYESCTEKQG
jgi:hypothetical protein